MINYQPVLLKYYEPFPIGVYKSCRYTVKTLHNQLALHHKDIVCVCVAYVCSYIRRNRLSVQKQVNDISLCANYPVSSNFVHTISTLGSEVDNLGIIGHHDKGFVDTEVLLSDSLFKFVHG